MIRGIIPCAGATACLPLCAAALLMAPARAHSADAACEANYLEVRTADVGSARALLHHHATLERAAASRGSASPLQIDVLHEIDRPQRWVLLERSDSEAALTTLDRETAASLTALQGLLVAPPDQHIDRALASAPGLAPDERTATPGAALYEVTHLDIVGGVDQSGTIEALGHFVAAARAARGNLRAEAWQQTDRANHYTLVSLWKTLADRAAFAATPAAREFRARVGPLLGSPYDDRFYSRSR